MTPRKRTAKSRVVLIGIGNDYRSDDGVGLIAARRLKAKHIPGTEVVEETGEGTALLETWKGVDGVVLLDAVSSGATPGTIHRFDAHADTIPAKFFHYSTHAFSVAEAIALARTLNQLPPHLIVYGIEGKNFEAGVRLSAEVEKAVEQVVEQVVEEVLRMPSAALKGGAGKHA